MALRLYLETMMIFGLSFVLLRLVLSVRVMSEGSVSAVLLTVATSCLIRSAVLSRRSF